MASARGEAITTDDLGGALAAVAAGMDARAAFGSGLSTWVAVAGELSAAAGSALCSTLGRAATAGSGLRCAVVGCATFAAGARGAAGAVEAAGAGTGSAGGARRRSLTRG